MPLTAPSWKDRLDLQEKEIFLFKQRLTSRWSVARESQVWDERRSREILRQVEC